MVSVVENIGDRPGGGEAREALASIEDAQRAVRGTPWPIWLYAVNAVLLGAMASTFLLREHGVSTLWALALSMVAINVTTGYRMGTPWVLPASRGFLTAVTISGLCVLAAFVVADVTERVWPVAALAVTATAVYGAGSVAHIRSTRPRR